MKKSFILLSLLMAVSLSAQNLVITKNLAIEGQIVGINNTEVKCKLPNGIVSVIALDTVQELHLANGVVRHYADGKLVSTTQESTSAKPNVSPAASLSATSGLPNDILVLKNSMRINAFVASVGDDMIKYKMPSQTQTYSIPKNDVVAILYQNGKTSVFLPATTAATAQVQGNVAPDFQYREKYSSPTNIDFPSGGIHTDGHGNKRVDFAGGSKTTFADGSTRIEVPFVTIESKDGGRGVDMPQCDDITGYQVQQFYAPIEDQVIIINKSSYSDCFKVAVCTVMKNHYIWRNVLTTSELRREGEAETEDDLDDILGNEDKYIYSVAVKSRSGKAYSFKMERSGDDLKIEVYNPGSVNSDW